MAKKEDEAGLVALVKKGDKAQYIAVARSTELLFTVFVYLPLYHVTILQVLLLTGTMAQYPGMSHVLLKLAHV